MSLNRKVEVLSHQVKQISVICGNIANCIQGLTIMDKLAKETELMMSPECHKRHEKIENHIEESKGWRTTLVTLVVTMLLQVMGFLYLWGRIVQRVEVNTDRITALEIIHPRGEN